MIKIIMLFAFRKSKKVSHKKQKNKGYIEVILIGIVLLGILFTANVFNPDVPTDTRSYIPTSPTTYGGYKSLELHTISFATPEAPTINPPQGNSCSNGQFNDEPGILVAYDPGPNKTVSGTGKIRVWVTDERPPLIAQNEKVDPTTGQITTPGDRTALDGRGQGYYIWEPALYITPLTATNTNGPFAGDAENKGKPYFPSIIKGDYNPSGGNGGGFGGGGFLKGGAAQHGPPIDKDYGNFSSGNLFGGLGLLKYASEYIWDVSTLGLTAGTYRAQFVIHDGDVNLGISCTTISI